MGADVGNQSAQDGQVAFAVLSIIGALIFVILIPLILMMYIDIATISAQVKAERKIISEEVVKMAKLRKELETERKKGSE